MKPTVLAGRCILLLVAMAFAAVTTTTANQSTNPPRWWNSEQYRRELGLTPEQSKRLEEIFQQAAPAQRDLLKKLEEAEAQFERLVASASEKVVIEQINTVVNARAELNRSNSIMLYRMRRVLTPDQWTRLGALKQSLERDRQKTSEKPK